MLSRFLGFWLHVDDEQKNQYDWGPWIACMGLVVLFWIIFALVLWPRDRDSEAKLAEFKMEYESRSNFQNAMRLQRRANRPGAANRKGDLQGAVNIYKRVTYEPAMAEKALLYSGLAKFQLKDYSGAIDDYTAAINLDLHPAWAFSARGVAKYVSGDEQGAMEDFQQSRDLDETLPWPLHNQVLIHINNGNNDEALEQLIYILKEFPKYPESYDTLGVLKYRQGQFG